MIANHVHDALAQVRQLRSLVLEKRVFRGYSGVARMAGGALALAGAGILASPLVPRTPAAQLAGWAAVLALALALNYGALALWRLRTAGVAGFFSPDGIRPVFDAMPAFAAGAALSVALVAAGQYDLLFGAWMLLYGLGHVPNRSALPAGAFVVGAFYMLCGAACLLAPAAFLNPWPMGLVFGAGECAGGLCFLRGRASPDDE